MTVREESEVPDMILTSWLRTAQRPDWPLTGHDHFCRISTSTQRQLEGLSDPEVLELAARERRVLVSHDKRTMPIHFTARVASDLRSPGVLLALPARLSARLSNLS